MLIAGFHHRLGLGRAAYPYLLVSVAVAGYYSMSGHHFEYVYTGVRVVGTGVDFQHIEIALAAGVIKCLQGVVVDFGQATRYQDIGRADRFNGFVNVLENRAIGIAETEMCNAESVGVGGKRGDEIIDVFVQVSPSPPTDPR